MVCNGFKDDLANVHPDDGMVMPKHVGIVCI
jgi:hypothetical protein